MKKHFLFFVLAGLFMSSGYLFGQKTDAASGIGDADLLGAPAPAQYARFFSYPTSHEQPQLIDSGDPASDQQIHELRLQHWYFIFDQPAYQKRYGALPQKVPGDLSPSEYAQNPPESAFSPDLEALMSGQAQPSKD